VQAIGQKPPEPLLTAAQPARSLPRTTKPKVESTTHWNATEQGKNGESTQSLLDRRPAICCDNGRARARSRATLRQHMRKNNSVVTRSRAWPLPGGICTR
jgi:hypothetical protein